MHTLTQRRAKVRPAFSCCESSSQYRTDPICEQQGFNCVTGTGSTSWVAGSIREVSGNLYPSNFNLSGRLRIYTYPGIRAKGWKSFLAVYPGRTSLSGQTHPGKKNHPGIRAKPGHMGNPLEPAGTSWYQLVPGWYPAGTKLANHCIRANLGIQVSGQILVSGQTDQANAQTS